MQPVRGAHAGLQIQASHGSGELLSVELAPGAARPFQALSPSPSVCPRPALHGPRFPCRKDPSGRCRLQPSAPFSVLSRFRSAGACAVATSALRLPPCSRLSLHMYRWRVSVGFVKGGPYSLRHLILPPVCGPLKSRCRWSCVRLFATPWAVARQAPPSMGFPRPQYWSGLPFLSLGDLPDPGLEPGSPTVQAGGLSPEPPGKGRYLCLSQRRVSLHLFVPRCTCFLR